MPVEPPAGFTDLLGDAEDAPPLGPVCELDVPGLGAIKARKPRPRSLAVLAAAYNDKLEDAERNAYLTRFLTDHIPDTQYEQILADMMWDRAPADTIDRLLRALCTWGTGRPYKAVLSLTVTAGEGWRVIRSQIPGDPMQMPSMHRVLDEVEKIVIQSQATGDPKQDKAALDAYHHRLYAPDAPKTLKGGKPAVTAPPSWWPADNGAAANAAAMKALGAIPAR